MNIVLDTSAIVVYLLSRRSNYTTEIIDLAKQRRIQLLACKESLAELKNTLAKGSTSGTPL